MRVVLFLVLLAPSLLLHAQQTAGWEQAFRELTGSDEAESLVWEDVYETLCELGDERIDLNRATREQLERLPFLSSQQVEGIVEYLYRYGPMKSVGELQMVGTLDAERRRLLEYFVTVGPPDAGADTLRWADVARYGRHELMGTAHVPMYSRKGDRNGYLGYKYRHWMRYQFNYHDRVKFGLTGAQDGGEPFFSNRNRLGYDHYSYYFQLRGVGPLEALNLGMYRVQAGMGLVVNTGYSLGKTAILQSLGRSQHHLRAHSSRSEAGYFQGAAATLRLSRRWRATAFASYRPLDATLNADSTVRTLVETGYHRTPAEMDKKHNLHATALGALLSYRSHGWRIGANAVYTHYDRQLDPQQLAAAYRQYYASGSDFLNLSLNYGYVHHAFAFSGETATNRDGALAAVHSLSLSPSSRWSLMLLHRYYDKRYTAPYARSFGEGSGVQNEHGLYLGGTWQPLRPLAVEAYADYAHFAAPRYLVSTSSDAFDTMLSLRWQGRRWLWGSRYRMHLRQRDNADKSRLVNRTEHRCRLWVEHHPTPLLAWRTQADGVVSRFQGQQSAGWMASQQVSLRLSWLRATALVGYFHTDDYDSRLYLYEPSLLYQLSIPMFYGHGLRYALTARAELGSSRLLLTAKLGVTDYFDRSTVSSGLQQIDHSAPCDLDVQLRWTF